MPPPPFEEEHTGNTTTHRPVDGMAGTTDFWYVNNAGTPDFQVAYRDAFATNDTIYERAVREPNLAPLRTRPRKIAQQGQSHKTGKDFEKFMLEKNLWHDVKDKNTIPQRNNWKELPKTVRKSPF